MRTSTTRVIRGSTASVVVAVILGVACVPSAVATHGPKCDEPTNLQVGAFGNSLTTLVAEAEGFIEDEGLEVDYPQVTSSTHQFQALRDGEYDLVLSAPDNGANYRLNQSNPLGQAFDVQAIAGMAYGQNLSLVAQPGVDSIDDLRGETLALDAPNSGFAYALYKLLRQHGLERGVDYELTAAGGNFQRYTALLAGEFDATLLVGGFELRAADAGFQLLASVNDVVPRYLGSVLLSRETWLKRHSCAAAQLVRAYRRAARWILDPSNRQSAIELLMTQPNTPPDLAERLYAVQVTPGVGVVPGLKIDRHGLLAVLRLRDEFDGFDEPHNLRYLVSPASGLYDRAYLRAASRPHGCRSFGRRP